MATSFPTGLDAIQRVVATDLRNAPGKEGHVLHNNLCDAVEALQAKVGVDGSAIATTIDNKLTGKMDATASALGTLISAATAKATPGDSDAMALADASASNVVKLLSWANLKAAIAAFLRAGGLISAGTVATPKIIANSVDSIPDSAADQSVLITCASSQGSQIGAQSKPAGAAGTNSDPAAATDTVRGLPWSNDLSYPNNGIAHISCVIGGYDHVCNQEAGCIVGGGHNFMPYNANGHSVIVGGSNSRNAGAGSAIIGGKNNTITSDALYGSVVSGSGCSIGANYAAAIGAQNGIVQSGHAYAVVLGRNPISEASGALTIGVKPLVWNGDCQSAIVPCGGRTTNTTPYSLPVADSTYSLGTLPCALSVVAQVIGVDEATGNMAAFTWTGSAKWNGSTTASISDTGGTAGAGRNMTQIVDEIGCSAVAMVAVDTGILRIRVYGKTSTNIKWCGRLDVCAVRV